MADEVKTLLDAPKTITIGGEKIEIREMRFEQALKALQMLGPQIGRLLTVEGDADILQLLCDLGIEGVDLMTLMSDEPREWVAELAIDDAVKLAGELYEVNRDFFIRRLWPAIQKTITKFGLTGVSLEIPGMTTPASTPAATGPASPAS